MTSHELARALLQSPDLTITCLVMGKYAAPIAGFYVDAIYVPFDASLGIMWQADPKYPIGVPGEGAERVIMFHRDGDG